MTEKRHNVPVEPVPVTPLAFAGGLWATDLVEASSDPGVLESGGRWFVVVPYLGSAIFLRFATWRDEPPVGDIGGWQGPKVDSWRSSMSAQEYGEAVEATRSAIAQGLVYQANICRVMRTEVDLSACDIARLHLLLANQNPAPYSAMVRVPELGLAIACASPELFLSRDSSTLMSGPIKGTGRTRDDLTDKDRAENVMIVDLVRNDLARVSQIGSIEVAGLLREEVHPGLVHLVSHVKGELLRGTTWSEIFRATFPPGSVTGAPKSSALKLIEELELVTRDFYCGAVGWIDADSDQASLSVAIRTFWLDGQDLCFGTGAGITWGSDPQREWLETELKAKHLIEVAASHFPINSMGSS